MKIKVVYYLKLWIKKNRIAEKKQEKKDILKNLYALFECRERVFNAWNSKYFQ